MAHFTLVGALSLFVFVSLARADFSVTCSNLYPEAGFPEHTTTVAEVTRDATGAINGLKCYTIPGDVLDVCSIADGACCPCNTSANGCVPECSVAVTYTETDTSGRCIEDFPPNYCQSSVSGAFVSLAPTAVTRRSKHRKHRRR